MNRFWKDKEGTIPAAKDGDPIMRVTGVDGYDLIAEDEATAPRYKPAGNGRPGYALLDDEFRRLRIVAALRKGTS